MDTVVSQYTLTRFRSLQPVQFEVEEVEHEPLPPARPAATQRAVPPPPAPMVEEVDDEIDEDLDLDDGFPDESAAAPQVRLSAKGLNGVAVNS